jgi:hypothetical protein
MQTGHHASEDLKEAKLATIRRKMELTHCPTCGEPYDLTPCDARHARIQEDRARVRPSLAVSLNAIIKSVR